MDRMPVLLLAILHLHLSCANVEKVQLQVVVNSTLCSVTCGMGIKVHTVCTMKDGEKRSGCYKSHMTWFIRLEITPQHLFFSSHHRVTWHRATGVISSDDLLFPLVITSQCVCKSLLYSPGTYRCDVLDANFRRLKTVYWGVRVLPKGILNLDYDHAQSVWDSPWNWKKYIMSRILDSPILWLYIVRILARIVEIDE
uniref:Transmembrane protein 81 n=1 Tax=Hippocampus comes TaxID=109280 RepID=A0A3Q2Z9D6_HIPCM